MPLTDLLRETHRPLWERIAGVFYIGKKQNWTHSSCEISIATAGKERAPSPLLTAWKDALRAKETRGEVLKLLLKLGVFLRS